MSTSVGDSGGLWVGWWEKFQKQKKKKKNRVGVGETIKFPKKKKKNRDQGIKKLGRGRGENKVAKKT
jgi:hypothetical protein